MKRIIEDIIWDVVNVDDIQFGFMSGLGTTNAIFILKQIQDKNTLKESQSLLCICWPRKGLQQGAQKGPIVGVKESRHTRVDSVWG